MIIQILPRNRLLIDIFDHIHRSVYSACNFTKTGPNFLSFWWFQNLAVHTNTYMLDDQPFLIDSTLFLSKMQSHDQNSTSSLRAWNISIWSFWSHWEGHWLCILQYKLMPASWLQTDKIITVIYWPASWILSTEIWNDVKSSSPKALFLLIQDTRIKCLQ